MGSGRMTGRAGTAIGIGLLAAWAGAGCGGSGSPSPGHDDAAAPVEVFIPLDIPYGDVSSEVFRDPGGRDDAAAPADADAVHDGSGVTDPGIDAADAVVDVGEACETPAAFNCPCAGNIDCQSGFCVATSTGKVCTKSCTENCPAGWLCTQVASSPDVVFECVPTHPMICHPCRGSTECKGPFSGEGALCVSYGLLIGHFCGGACAADTDCPGGYACRDSDVVEGGQARQCVRSSGGECACTPTSIGKTTDCLQVNGDGACKGQRTCSPGGLPPCDAATPVPEVCNQVDDNCNQRIDEDCDHDGVEQDVDNCPLVQNALQEDLNGDGEGDACDPDIDGDGVGNGTDCGPKDRTVCPGCAEVCDGKDNDCDTFVDEGLCDDGNACTDDSCDPAGLCRHVPDDGKCDDGNACTADSCDAVGGCTHTGTADACYDGNPCTEDQCDETKGCLHPPRTNAACNDGNACTYEDACDGTGSCRGTPSNCTDDPGTCGARRTCNGTAACDTTWPGDATACNDDRACTYGDHCDGAGGCVGVPVSCSDDPGLCGARRLCNGTATCTEMWPGIASACDDGNDCTWGDHCDGAGGCTGTTVTCTNDPGTCGRRRACNGTASCEVYFPGAGTACEDGSPCTWGDHCDSAGGCAGTPLTCTNDPGPCGAIRTCDGTATCAVTYPGAATSCNDNALCTYGDHCDGAGGCTGNTVTCANDAGACGATRTCNGTATCTVTYPGSTVTCSSDGICTVNYRCDGGGNCNGQARNCNDSNPCTFDFCLPFPFIGGCIHDPQDASCTDNDATTIGDACVGGTCVPGPKCGNSVCDKLKRETCATCGADCGSPCPATESNCTDGWDDDGDGSIDCSDGDCLTVAPCNGATCRHDVDVLCGSSLSSQSLSGNDASGTACGDPMSGSDRVYRFIAPASQNVVFAITNGGDSDTYSLYVLKDVCDAARCTQTAWSTTSVQLTVAATVGTTYYIVADGSSAASSFDFDVVCK